MALRAEFDPAEQKFPCSILDGQLTQLTDESIAEFYRAIRNLKTLDRGECQNGDCGLLVRH
jgi:hypothetical protein